MEHRSKELFDPTMPRNGSSRKAHRGARQGAILLLILVGLAVFGVVALVGPLAPKRFTAHNPGRATVERRAEVQRTLPLQGTLELTDQGVLTAPEAGTVALVGARTGEVVPRGQILVRIDARELKEEFQTLMAQQAGLEERVGVLNQEATLVSKKIIEENSGRTRELARKATLVAEQADLASRGLVSPRDLRDQEWSLARAREADTQAQTDESLTRLRTDADLGQAVRDRDTAQKRIEALETRLAGCVVRSPDELLVLGADQDQVRPGTAVVRYQTLMSYALLNQAEVRFDVPQYAAGALGVGSSLEIRIDGKALPARVTHKSQVSTDKSSNTAVAARLETLPRPLIQGQSVETTLKLEKLAQALTLPPGAWVGSGHLEWVYKLSPDGTTATKTKVRLSTDYDQVIVVLGGLEEHDRVLTDASEEFGGAETIAIEGASHAGTQRDPQDLRGGTDGGPRPVQP